MLAGRAPCPTLVKIDVDGHECDVIRGARATLWWRESAAEAARIDEILETHLIKGGRVQRLMLTPDQREPE